MLRFDSTELRDLILTQYGTYKEFAKELGTTSKRLEKWLDTTTIPLDAIRRMVDLLGVADLDVDRVFFTRAN